MTFCRKSVFISDLFRGSFFFPDRSQSFLSSSILWNMILPFGFMSSAATNVMLSLAEILQPSQRLQHEMSWHPSCFHWVETSHQRYSQRWCRGHSNMLHVSVRTRGHTLWMHLTCFRHEVPIAYISADKCSRTHRNHPFSTRTDADRRGPFADTAA